MTVEDTFQSDTEIPRLTIKISGSEVSEHEIDAKNFGTVIIGWSEVTDFISNDTAPSQRPVLKITPASVRAGSLLVDLFFYLPDATETFIGAINSATGQAVTGLSSISGVLLGALSLLKRQPSDPVNEAQTNEEFQAARWIYQKDFLEPLIKATNPLDQEGFLEMEISVDATQGSKIKITKDDRQFFQNALVGSVGPGVSERRVVDIVSFDFRPAKPWRLTSDGQTFEAFLEDEDFQRKIDEGEVRIGIKDKLEIELKHQQRPTPSGKLRPKRVITEVYELIPG